MMIKDKNLTQNVLDSLCLAQEAAVELYHAVDDNNNTEVVIISSDMIELLSSLHSISVQLAEETPATNFSGICDSALDSLHRIVNAYELGDTRVCDKIEYELIPILQDAYLHFYFWVCVYPDPIRMKHYYENERKLLISNDYINESEKNKHYKYEVSIVVLAYNKLEYTKMCVESILETIPQNLNYELILINHGSTDGTKEYFESIRPTKQLDIKVNCALFETVCRIIEGEYVIIFSNDVVACENAIANMIKCMKDNPQIGFGVPTTPNVSNLQTIPFEGGETLEGVREFASKNNVYDPFRHEQRSRLCNPVTFYRSYTMLTLIGVLGYFVTQSKVAYPDDVISLLTRRNRYKNILAKDAYCYHFGSVTINDEMQKINIAVEAVRGSDDFYRVFGIDPWSPGFCYEESFLQLVELMQKETISVLGINCGLGSSPLKIKEMYKEQQHILDVTLYNVTDQSNYLFDLIGISDYAQYLDNVHNIFSKANNNFPHEYDHIVVESHPDEINECIEFISDCQRSLTAGGAIYMKIYEQDFMKSIQSHFKNTSLNEYWIRINA